ncbi:MAG: YihY family inner membrane protein [Phycisphaeraceae bacterium]|nr:YihY family inner membrane protein [Phycisphaeraceae bacterium]
MPSPLHQWKSLVHQTHAANVSRRRRAAGYTARLSWIWYRQFREDRAPQMAAALTYRTVFSLLPTLVLILVVLQAFRGLEENQESFKDTILNLIPERLLEADISAPPVTSEAVPTAMPDAASPAPPAAPTASPADAAAVEQQAEQQAQAKERRQELGDFIGNVIDQLAKVNFARIGAVGLLLFIYGATTLLATVEQSFNQVLGVDQGRPWYIRVTYYYAVITLGPMVLVAGQFIQQKAFSLLAAGGDLTGWLAGPLVILSPLLTAWIVLAAIYTLLPHARVPIKHVLIGSFVAAALWVISKEAFTIYVARTAVTSLYGALGLVPLFLFWLYVTWLIILFGLELTYSLSQVRNPLLDEESYTSTMIGDPAWTVPVMVRLGQLFTDGQGAAPTDLAADLGLPTSSVQRLCANLTQAGLLHTIAGSDEDVSTYALARPPAKITVADLLTLGRQWSRTGLRANVETCWQYLDHLHQSQDQLAGQTSLQDLLDKQAASTVPPAAKSAT